jgi:hypothetical protein
MLMLRRTILGAATRENFRMPSRLFVQTLSATIFLTVLASACSGDDSDGNANPDGNLFLNPGFEETYDNPDDQPWFTLAEESGFTISQDYAYSGSNSALLAMDDPAEATGKGKVYYLVQEITPDEMPEVVEGFYRVENWRRGTPLQYLQFVVIALEPKNFPTFASNYQIRYILAGIDAPPFDIRNAHFSFLSREDPVIGEWVEFSVPLRDDFKRLWNAIPEDFSKLRLLFEVRWDDKREGSGAIRGDVYYDDLYIGDER